MRLKLCKDEAATLHCRAKAEMLPHNIAFFEDAMQSKFGEFDLPSHELIETMVHSFDLFKARLISRIPSGSKCWIDTEKSIEEMCKDDIEYDEAIEELGWNSTPSAYTHIGQISSAKLG